MAPFFRLSDPELPRGVILTIGNFDGVHRGHQVLIDTLLEQADRSKAPAIVLTFDPPPAKILVPERCPPQLTTPEQKAKLLMQLGVDGVVVCPTDRALLELSPWQFFAEIVLARLQARGLVEGPNFFFGKDRAGDIPLLSRLCEEHAVTLTVVRPQQIEGQLISSSEIRKALQAGDVATAEELLGRPYSLTGRVITGAQRGRTLGFPTANISEIPTLIPADGVYAGSCLIEGQRWPAAVHIGPNPTFAEGERKVEAHIIDFSGNLYDQPLTIDLIDRVRGTRKFPDVSAIIEQIEQDILLVRALVE